jgi:gliding motility-associated-like protein
MRKIVLLVLFMLLMAGDSFGQAFSWGIGNGASNQDITRTVGTDAQNNVYQVIFYSGSLTLDSAGTPKVIGNYGLRDIAVVKYNCSKVFQWAIRIGGTNTDGGLYNNAGLAFDTSGNVYIHATVNGTVNITAANGSNQSRTGFGNYDAMLIKATSAGAVTWITQLGSNGSDEAGAISIDREQNIYITGQFTSNATVTSTSGPNVFVGSFGSADIYLVKYDAAGVRQYSVRGGGNLFDNGSGIDIDSSGNAYVSGGWGCCGNSFVNFGANNLNNTGGWGAFLAKADASGNWQWAVGMGNNANEVFGDVVVDEVNDRIYVIGHFDGNTTISSRLPGVGVALTTAGLYDVIIACYDLNGSIQWTRKNGGTGNEYGFGAALDLDRNPAFAGEFSSSTNFGGTTLAPTGTGSAYFAKYSKTNTLLNAQKVGSGSFTRAWDINYGISGLAYLSGYYNDSIVVGTDVLRSNGVEDGFVVRMQDLDTNYIGATNTNLNCSGDTSTLFVSNKDFGTFTWFRNDTLISGSTSNMIKTTLPGTYKVTSSNSCAVPTTSANLVVNRSLFYSAPQVSDISVCVGDSAKFDASGATTYRWRPAAGLSDTTIANPFVKPSNNTTYFLTMTQGPCIAFDTIAVTLQNNCCLTCASPFQLNQGAIACYSFTGNAQDESGHGNHAEVFNATLAQDRFGVNNRAYQFNGFNSYLEVPNSSTLQSPSTNITFTFWARVTNWNFNAGVQYTPILSKSTSTTDAQYRAMIRTNGAYAMANSKSFNGVIGSVTNANTWYFFAVSVSNDTLYYYRNGALLGFAVGSVPYTLNSTTPLRMGRNDVNTQAFFSGRLDEVRIYGRTLSAAQITALYNLSAINGLPTISAGVDKNICKGDSIQLTTVGSTGTYLWTPSFKLSSDTIKSPNSWPDVTTNYIARVEVSGCMNYDTINVNVVDFRPDIGVDRTICNGDSAQLIVANGGNTFAWAPNYRISPTNNDTIKVFPQVDTNYIVTTNNGLCSRTDTVRVSVIVPTINAGSNLNVCDKDTAFFNVISNGTVRWSPFKYLSDSVGANVYSVPDSSIIYYLTANYLGCIARDTVDISVAFLPVDAGANQQICFGDSVQLQATGSASFVWIPTYRISDTSIANPWVKPLVPTYYYAIAYNSLCSRYDSVFVDVKKVTANAGSDKSICRGDSIPMNATAAGTYTWSPTLGLADTSLTTYAKPTTTTNYVLNVTNGLCSNTDTVRVTVTNFVLNAGPNKQICQGDSVQLIATGAPKYNWLPNYNISDTGIANPWVKPLAPTNYFCIANNGICVRVDTVFVNVRLVPGTAGTDTSMCTGQFVGLNASGSATYEWINKVNISDRFIPNPIVTPATDAKYILKMTDGAVCYRYDTVEVKVFSYPLVNAGPDFKHCPGDYVTLNGSVTGAIKYEWSPALGLNDKNLMQPLASVTVNTYYTLGAWNGNCYNYDVAFVEVNPPVNASFKADPNQGLAPLPVQFTNNSSNAISYDWDFGEAGGTSTEKDPLYIYKNDGIYTVKLTVLDDLGCEDTTTATINVRVIESLQAPTAFTPNGDGLNDNFAFVYAPNRFEFLEVAIFNRWGVKVFESKMPGGTWWDGKVNGIPEPPDIYTYTAVAKDKKGKSYELNGTIALVR